MRVTQKDIAAALELSLITVQRAFNDSGYVSKEVRERIFAYAHEVNYVPHKASQVLKRNKTRRLVVISTTEPSYFWADVRSGIELAARQIEPFDYKVDYFQVPETDAPGFLSVLKRVVDEGVDAVGFVNKWPQVVAEAAGWLDDRGLPYATFNVDAEATRRVCHVGPDYRSGGRLAAEYLGKALFFRDNPRVLVIGTVEDTRPQPQTVNLNRQRIQGFEEVLAEQFPHVRVDVRRLPANLTDPEAADHLDELARTLGSVPEAIYMTAPYNPVFLQVLERYGLDRTYSVLHDLDKTSFHFLETHRLMAVVCQNPILQGYDTVKILEQVLDTGQAPADIEVVHSLVFNANKEHYSNTGFAGAISEAPFPIRN